MFIRAQKKRRTRARITKLWINHILTQRTKSSAVLFRIVPTALLYQKLKKIQVGEKHGKVY